MKTAIITGGAQGIGKAISLRFLQEKYNVVIADIDKEAGKKTVIEYEKIGNITFLHSDISNEIDAEKLIHHTIKKYGQIDALINNAGVFEYIDFDKLSLKKWNEIISTNLTSTFLCSKSAAKYLKKTKGSIVNIASTRAIMSEPCTEAYSASKGGLIALPHAMANTLGPDIRVNCISPGWIEVSEWKKSPQKQPPELTETDHKQHPAGRVGRAEDISEMAFYLCSDKSGFITGSNFVIDGGMTRKMIYAE